jgi:hypothetical protein
MFRLLLQRRGTIRFPAHAQGIVKMAWFGDVHLKQRAVTEFLVEKKESVIRLVQDGDTCSCFSLEQGS